MDNIETISIDLTEDDACINSPELQNEFVDCNNLMINGNERIPTLVSYSILPRANILPEHQANILPKNINPSSKILNNCSEMSSEHLIKSLQEENPQIETVFIESDEDNQDDNTKKVREPELTKTRNTVQEKEALTPIKALNTTNFAVRAISPSRLSQNMVKNSNTIALQEEMGNRTSKKFLMIPNEVAPILAKSQGPISFNIPGIGPLLIPKPSVIFNSKSVTSFTNLKKSVQESEPRSSPLKKNLKEHVYDPLSDSKYCWRYQKGRKRDMEGFSISDRLGFYKAEQHRSKLCAAKYNGIIKKLQLFINMKKRALMAIKSSKLNMENIKLVEIDSIKKKKKRDLVSHKDNVCIRSKMSPSISKTPRTIPVVPEKYSHSPVHMSCLESDDEKSDNDLLVTKKVVFINETEKHRGRKRKVRQGKFSNHLRKRVGKHDQDHKLLPKKEVQCKSNNKSIDVQSKRGRPKQHEITSKNAFCKKTDGENLTSLLDVKDTKNANEKIRIQNKLARTKGKRGSPIKKEQLISCKRVYKGVLSKDKETQKTINQSHETENTKKSKLSKLPNMKLTQKLSHCKNVYEIKDCYVEISPDDFVLKAVEKYNNYTLNCIQNLEHSCKIIDNLQLFQNEIQPNKPMLILNEVHCVGMNFEELYSKYNIVFPMLEDLNFSNLNIKNLSFAEAARVGHVKFVRPRCLCQYLAGFRV